MARYRTGGVVGRATQTSAEVTAPKTASILRHPLAIESLLRWCFVAGVFSLWLGGLGGSFQPSRLILFVALSVIFLVARRVIVSPVGWPIYGGFVSILVLGVLTLPFSEDPKSGLALMTTVALGMASILLVRGPVNLRTARQIRDAWSYGLIVTLPIAVYEILSGNHFAYALDRRNVGGAIGDLPFASVFFGNYNNYSAYVCLAYPMLLGTMLEARTLKGKLSYLLAVVVTLAITIINTSRIAILFVGISTIVILSVWHRRNKLVLLFLGAAALFFVPASGFDLRYAQLRFAADLLTDQSALERAGLIAAGFDAMRETFGVGLGPGGFVPFAAQRYPDLIPNPHNMLIEFAVNFSLFGALSFFGVLAVLFLRVRTRLDLPPALRLPVLVTLPFVPLIGSLNSLAVGYTYWWYWIAATFLISLAHDEHR